MKHLRHIEEADKETYSFLVQNRSLTDGDAAHASSSLSSGTIKKVPHKKNRPHNLHWSPEHNMEAPSMITAKNTSAVENKIVGSMSTTPVRLKEINGALGLTLSRLLSFSILDKIYLNIPWEYSLRTKHEKVKLSLDLLAFVDKANGRLVILRCHDYGPSTKLLPLLLLSDSELPPESTIITFDDDRLYQETAVKALIDESIIRPGSVITIAAWPIGILSSTGKRGRPGGPDFSSRIKQGSEGVQYKKAGQVDLVLGFFGVLYKKMYFYTKKESTTKGISILGPDKLLFDYSTRADFSNHCTWVDDIWFSGHLERLNITKYAVGKKDDTAADITKLSHMSGLSVLREDQTAKQNDDNVICAEAMRKEFGIWGEDQTLSSPSVIIERIATAAAVEKRRN